MIEYSAKKKLAKRISRLKNKRHMVTIGRIIQKDNSHLITENNNGLFIIFNKLTDPTYKILFRYLNTIHNK